MLGLYHRTSLNMTWRVAKIVIKLPNWVFCLFISSKSKQKPVMKYFSFRLTVFLEWVTKCQKSSFIQVVLTEHLQNFAYRLGIKDENNYT